jgi:hypothetical protein
MNHTANPGHVIRSNTNMEQIAILTAIAVVSKRLAGRLARLESQSKSKTEGRCKR